jgi:Zn-dependent peptidase ImmA (M78 family)
MPLLLMNATASEPSRRAALGHMLGHVLMRLDDPTTPYPRDTESDHHLADMMADEFILPEFMVRDQAAKWFNDFRYLARLFGVSENDMMERMRELGIIKSRGVLWDY